MKQTNKVQCKSTKLIEILSEFLVGKMNLAHIRFFGLFICALCKVQSVSFVKLSAAFESKAKSESSLRRIQRFVTKYNLDFDLIARLIFRILPHKPPFRLAMDRTNWKFGIVNINVLMLAVVYKGVAFPLMISMLDKRGNSDTKERIDMINKYIRLFGKDTIDCLLADREFVGSHWIKYLNDNKIRYHIRIRENFYVERRGEKNQSIVAVFFAAMRTNDVFTPNLLCQWTTVLSLGIENQGQTGETRIANRNFIQSSRKRTGTLQRTLAD